MLTKEQFESLDVDDLIEGPPLFPGLDPKQKLTLSVVQKTHNTAVLDVAYAGVYLDTWTFAMTNDVVQQVSS
jgi:hypothetical protein